MKNSFKKALDAILNNRLIRLLLSKVLLKQNKLEETEQILAEIEEKDRITLCFMYSLAGIFESQEKYKSRTNLSTNITGET